MDTYDRPMMTGIVKWAMLLAVAGVVGGFVGRLLWPHRDAR